MKTVLVSGSAGFAGAHFVDHVIANSDWKIVGLDSFRHRGDSLRVYQPPERYTVHTHDISTPISHRLADKIGPVDFIINMASESSVDRSISDPVPFVQNNVNLALTMLEYARVVKPKAFIQFGTDEACGPAPLGTVHEEWSTVLPSNPYAASKAAQEAIAFSYWRTFKVPTILTRTMNLTGERQDPEKFIPMIISRVANGETVGIHSSGGRVGSRFYIHCRNMASALLFILNKVDPIPYSDLVDRPDMFNIVGDDEIDNLSLAKMIADIMGKPLKYELVEWHKSRPGHDLRYALSGEKLANLGWKAPISFRQSLEKTIEWTLSHPEWLK